ncbi:MAG: putative bifunctional diguanylate cyclase/phosphodiesterase, partial [Gammaproteobacteria bacterium]
MNVDPLLILLSILTMALIWCVWQLRNHRASLEEQQLRLRHINRDKNLFESALTNTSDAVLIISASAEVLYVNTEACRLLGQRKTELLGRSFDQFVGKDMSSQISADPDDPQEIKIRHADGQQISVICSRQRIEPAGDTETNFLVSLRDISAQRDAEQQVRYMSRFDALTKIPNRMQFQHLLHTAIAKRRRSPQSLALLYLDIDRFKDVNDTFSQAAGDTCLENMAQRLLTNLPGTSVVGRLASDQFAIILEDLPPGTAAIETITQTAAQLLRAVSTPVQWQKQLIHIATSIGIAIYPDHGSSAIELTRNADAALKATKHHGGNDFRLYTPGMNAEEEERLALKSNLRQSFENDELLLHYQPKVDLQTGLVVGAEALARWRHPEKGLVYPAKFIPLAEETKLILEIGEWVLNRACADYHLWNETIDVPGRISANLSLLQLRQPDFIQRVKNIFAVNDVSPHNFELEITETTIMEDAQQTVKTLNQLHDLGVNLAIDDFGTGYSSLSALQD